MGAIGVHHTATTDRTWDGPAAVAAASNDPAILRFMHAWYSGENPDQKSSYKDPHHGPRVGSPAVLPACRAVLQRLSKTNVPEADKAGIAAHARAHLADAGQQ